MPRRPPVMDLFHPVLNFQLHDVMITTNVGYFNDSMTRATLGGEQNECFVVILQTMRADSTPKILPQIE